MGQSKQIHSGTIVSDQIRAAHTQMKKMVDRYGVLNMEVASIAQSARENWVGDGRNEFENQYRLLIRKIEDFGDTLKDIYHALVEAEASYGEVDDQIRQDYTMAMQDQRRG